MANAVLGANLYPSIHDTVDGLLLAGGQIFFYEEDQVTPQAVYMDPFRNNAYSNPLVLGSVGQEPPIYYEPESTYWIEIYRSPAPGCPCIDEMPLYSFFFYPSVEDSETSEFANNFISNGQFAYPISFNRIDEPVGIINNPHTFVAQGWEFDATTSSQNQILVSFIPLFTTSTIPANPQNYFNLQVNQFGSGITKLDLYQTIGYVNILQGREVTLSLNGFSSIGASEQIEVIVENIYDGEDVIETTVGTLEITSTLAQSSLVFTFPTITNNPIDSVNNKTNLRLRFPLSTIINVSITNVQIEIGNRPTPVFIESPKDEIASRSFFNHYVGPEESTSFAGESEFSNMTYINNQFSWSQNTGIFEIVYDGSIPDDMEVCTGQTVNITDYSAAGIPYQRLYDKIGNTFGGNSDSVVAISSDEVVTISPPNGGRENSAYTVGNLGTLITITKTVTGYQLETVASLITAVSLTSIRLENLTPGTMNTTPGSLANTNFGAYCYWGTESGLPAIVDINNPNNYSTEFSFLSVNANDYVTRTAGGSPGFDTAISMFDFSSLNPVDTTRADYNASSVPVPSYNVIRFKVDGAFGGGNVDRLVGVVTVDVEFSSSKSLRENLNTFIKTVNNGFEYTLTVNSTLTGSAGSYFFYSSVTTDYYGWIRVDGGGVDPAIPGRTSVPIDIASTDDLDEQASKIASSISTSTFSFPSSTDFPIIPNANLVYAVHL